MRGPESKLRLVKDLFWIENRFSRDHDKKSDNGRRMEDEWKMNRRNCETQQKATLLAKESTKCVNPHISVFLAVTFHPNMPPPTNLLNIQLVQIFHSAARTSLCPQNSQNNTNATRISSHHQICLLIRLRQLRPIHSRRSTRCVLLRKGLEPDLIHPFLH